MSILRHVAAVAVLGFLGLGQTLASPVDGPRRTTEIVRPYGADVYTVFLRGGETTTIILSGDGDTDLDVLVYDDDGDLIAQTVGSGDQATLRVTPRYTGQYRIRVKNRGGLPNQYTLIIR